MDKAKEFYNKLMKDLLEKNNLDLHSREIEERLSVMERWHHTIKRMIWKYFTANNTTQQSTINVLLEIIDKYNNT